MATCAPSLKMQREQKRTATLGCALAVRDDRVVRAECLLNSSTIECMLTLTLVVTLSVQVLLVARAIERIVRRDCSSDSHRVLVASAVHY